MSDILFRSIIGGRNVPTMALVTYLIAVIAWVAIVARWLPMPGGNGMAMEMSAPGVPEAMALASGPSGILLYLFMWGVMMIAMMYPSSVPLFRFYSRTLAGTTKLGKAARLSTFMGAYALVWALTGIIPLVVNAVVPIANLATERGSVLIGGTLILVAAYQLSPYKHRCLKYCRTPFGFLMEYNQPGIRGAAQMSFRFSMFCVGCCWALFALMVVVGSMNLLWMAGITVVLSLERVIDRGDVLARAVGIIAGVAGAITLGLTVGGVGL